MKNAAKKWWNYLLILIFAGLIIGIGLLLHFKINNSSWPLKYSWYFMIFAGVALILIGFIIQDLFRGWNRHKLHDWDNPLPEKIINKAWMIFFPLLVSGGISFIVGLLSYLITK